MTPEQRAASDARAEELIVEYRGIQQLRKALGLTQVQLAERMGIKQDNVSRLENRDDYLLSTLANVIRAMGGTLELRATFPDRPTVILDATRMAEDDPSAPNNARA